jgi:hypothetical protein
MLLILQTFIRQVVGGIVGAKGGEVAGEKEKKNSESLGGVAGGVQYRRGIVGCIDRTIVMAGSRR